MGDKFPSVLFRDCTHYCLTLAQNKAVQMLDSGLNRYYRFYKAEKSLPASPINAESLILVFLYF